MNKVRLKMPPAQRAKQFAPFDAVVGLRKALRDKEKIRVPKKEISEDMAEEINNVLINIKVGDVITAVYYNGSEQEYIQLTGKVTLIDGCKKIINIGNRKIDFDDLYNLAMVHKYKNCAFDRL